MYYYKFELAGIGEFSSIRRRHRHRPKNKGEKGQSKARVDFVVGVGGYNNDGVVYNGRYNFYY